MLFLLLHERDACVLLEAFREMWLWKQSQTNSWHHRKICPLSRGPAKKHNVLCPPTKYLRYLEKPLKTIISYCLWKTGCTGTTPLCSPETYIQLPLIFCLVLYCINSLLEKSPSPAILPPTKSLCWPCQTVFLNRKLKHTGYLFSLFKYGCYLGLNLFFRKILLLSLPLKILQTSRSSFTWLLHLTSLIQC